MLDGALDRPAELVGVGREGRDAPVELAAQVEQLLRLLRHDVLLPAERDGLEHRPEGHGRGQRDALAERELHNGRVRLEGG